jgi:ubiquinone/menaquinone biosynthesis C-methylase UbiE
LDPWLFQVGAWPYDWMTANRVWQQSSADLLAPFPSPAVSTTVLDLGIGPGVSALSMGRARPMLRFLGVDISRPMLKLASAGRERAGWPASRLMLMQADAAHLPLANKVLDAAAGHSFLYLLPDRPAVLRETARVLRPGGWVAFMEPNAGRADWNWLLRQGSGKLLVSVSLWRSYNWLHGRFSPESMAAALEQAGFTDVSTESTLGGFGIYGRASKR